MRVIVVYRLSLYAAGGLAVVVGATGLRPIRGTVAVDPVTPTVLTDSAKPGSLDSLAPIVVESDLFRMSRSPAPVPFQLVPPEPVHAEPRPPKPQLVLTGIVWSEEPSAVVEGLPDVEGARVLRVGESSGGIRIRRITRHDVTLVGMDTTWVLQVRKPW